MTSINQKVFQGLAGAVETMRIVKELIEIWPNEVCDNYIYLYICNSCISLLGLLSLMYSNKEDKIK